jgi:hypothetical protein
MRPKWRSNTLPMACDRRWDRVRSRVFSLDDLRYKGARVEGFVESGGFSDKLVQYFLAEASLHRRIILAQGRG